MRVKVLSMKGFVSQKRGYVALLKDIYPGENIETSIDVQALERVFSDIFEVMASGSSHSGRIVKAVKLYYHLEKTVEGSYCNSFRVTGENIENFNIKYSRSAGVTGARAASLVKMGLRALRHPQRKHLFEPFFRRQNNIPALSICCIVSAPLSAVLPWFF